MKATSEEHKTKLSAREREVLSYHGTGLTSQEIADLLFLSNRTVDFHLANVRKKLGCDTTAKAYVIAVRSGQVECACGRT